MNRTDYLKGEGGLTANLKIFQLKKTGSVGGFFVSLVNPNIAKRQLKNVNAYIALNSQNNL